MLKKSPLLLFILFAVQATAQELVPNGSFENITLCPSVSPPSQIHKAEPWTNPTLTSPDLFNACDNGAHGVPSNFMGNQQARTGVGYAGVYTWGYREYIQAPLNDTLEAGKEYCLTFYVSLGDNIYAACHNVGAFFSDTAVYTLDNDSTPLPFIPQVENTISNPLLSKTEWIPVTGSFIANGTETYIIVGNFRTNVNSDTTTLFGTMNMSAYCYIDDVSLVECSVPPPSNPPSEAFIEVPNVFTPNGDGINDLFLIESTGIENIHCEIFDRWGIKVASISRLNEGWDGRTTSGQEAIEGVYYYMVNARNEKGEKITKKGFVQLLR